MTQPHDELKRLANGMTRAEIGQAFDELIESYEQLQSKLDKACEALEFYAGNKDGKWESHVCDSWSGLNFIFDWNGDTQDEPNEVAIKALAEIRKKDE